MAERDHNNYGGRALEIFTILSKFELGREYLDLCFDTWRSTAAFDAGAEAIASFTQRFTFKGDDFGALKSANAEIFEDIEGAALAIVDAGGTHYLEFLHLDAAKAVLVITAVKLVSEDDKIQRVKTAPEYHQIIQDNLSLVQNVIGLAWMIAGEDPFLSSLSKNLK